MAIAALGRRMLDCSSSKIGGVTYDEDSMRSRRSDTRRWSGPEVRSRAHVHLSQEHEVLLTQPCQNMSNRFRDSMETRLFPGLLLVVNLKSCREANTLRIAANCFFVCRVGKNYADVRQTESDSMYSFPYRTKHVLERN